MVSTIIGIKQESQRVQNKNFKLLNGKPLYSWIIDTLLKVNQVTEILINIEGDKLLDMIYKDYGEFSKIKLIERNSLLLGHKTPMTEIIYSTAEHSQEDKILNTHVTNPFLSENTITSAICLFETKKRPLFSVNVLKSRLFNHKLKPINHDLENLIQTQDLKPIFEENSCLYLFGKENFMKHKKRVFPNSLSFPISKIESVDIDTIEDWNLAEKIAKQL